MSITAGAASCVVNCSTGDHLRGQLYHRGCKETRDDLEINLLYINEGDTSLLLGSFDLCFLPEVDLAPMRTAVHEATGIPVSGILFSATHTHSGPQLQTPFAAETDGNPAYAARLQDAVIQAAKAAVESAKPARIGYASGQAMIGYNRRLCFEDGSHSMYGDITRPDFTGLEGPVDPSHSILFVQDSDGNYLAVAHGNACHTTCVESSTFASADFPGETRRLLREALGDKLSVLYLQGASADLSPWNMMIPPRYDGEKRMKEIGLLLAGETLRLLRETPTHASLPIRHAHEKLELGVRLPDEATLAGAEKFKAMGLEKAGIWNYVISVNGILALQERFGDNPVDTLSLHAIRIGDYALATNTVELYCQFGLDIKRRSPAKITAIAQLTDGFNGYCPTIDAQLGGGYSGSEIEWCRLEANAGYKLVDATSRLLHGLWRE